MTNTPASRPDVDTIERRVKLYGAISGKHTLALIAYIGRLEAAEIAVLIETDFAIRPASGEPLVKLSNKHGTAHRKLRDLLAGLPVPEALATLEEPEEKS